MDSERRQQKRLRVEGTVTVKTADGTTHSFAPLVDMSTSGCYIETLFPFPVGTQLQLAIALKELDVTVEVAAIVRTADQGVGMGVQFDDEHGPRLQDLLDQLEKTTSD